MEFSVFATWINIGRKLGQELLVKDSADKFFAQDIRINTGGYCLESQTYEGSGKFCGISFPERKDRSHFHSRQILLTVLSDILQSDIPKGHSRYSLLAAACQYPFHLRPIFFIGRVLRDADFLQGKTQGFRL